MKQKEIFATVVKKLRKMSSGKHIIKYQKYLLKKGYTKITIYHYIGDIKRYINGVSTEPINMYIKKINSDVKIRKSSKDVLKRFYNYISGKTQNKIKYKLPEVVKRYFNFYRTHRNLKNSTLNVHKSFILKFLEHINLKNINVFSIDSFIQKYTKRMKRSSINCLCSAVRSFLKFLYLHNYTDKDFSNTIVHPKIYSERLIPKHISQEKIKLILNEVDTSTVGGKRDYAILLLLVNYGLRPKEIAELELDDIDFRYNKLFIRERKCGDDLVLPLNNEVKQSILSYINQREHFKGDRIFLNKNAPHRQLNTAGISNIVKRYIDKAQLKVPIKGAYLMRHSLAKHLLEQGVDIVSIGSILGHKCISSTMQYLRVNVEELKEITDNYANLL